MSGTKRTTQRLINRLELYYPFITQNAEEYIQISNMELIVHLNDGSTILYDDVDQTFRQLPNDSNCMTEDQCRYEFGMRLKRIMYRKGFTQKDLSEETGISEITLSKYITGKSTPNFYNVDKIAKALKCSIDDLRYY